MPPDQRTENLTGILKSDKAQRKIITLFSCRAIFWEREQVEIFKMESLAKG